MVYITGDTHGDFRRRFNMENFPEQRDMDKGDCVIICGDFGGVWDYRGENKEEQYWMEWFQSRSYTLLFVDGNHENFERLSQYPVKQWHGGLVHEIRPTVLHLMRGQIFDIGGRTFFAFGGARSHDISGGILEPDDPDFVSKKRRLDNGYEPYRINHRTWWEQEMPSEEEMNAGKRNLLAHDNRVDFIITHCASGSSQLEFEASGLYKTDPLTDYFDWVKENVQYQKWFYGHYHDNINVNRKEILIYEQMIRIL